MQEIICDITRECYLLSAFLKSEILKESFSHRANPNRSFFFFKACLSPFFSKGISRVQATY